MLGLGTIGQFTIGQVGRGTAEVVSVDKWFVSLSEPKRFRAGLGSPSQQFTAYTSNPTTVTPFAWFAPLSELVVKNKIGLRTGSQQALAFQHPFVSFSWMQGLSEPKRFRSRLIEANQQSLVETLFPTILIDWFVALSEPKRFRPRLIEGRQQFIVSTLIPTILVDWFAWLSEPVRIKRGLKKELQPTLVRAEFVPINYSAQLRATEQRDFFLGVLYQFNIPVRAYVDIIENDPRHLGNVGIVENMARAAIVSINEPQAIPATGTPVSVAGARVAIITGP